MALNNDFRTNRRTYNERGGFFGQYTGVDALYPSAGPYSINTNSHILSTGVNLLNVFALSGAVASSSVFTTVNANSGFWSSAYTAVAPNSAFWNSNYTTTNANSANWSGAYTAVAPNSANWNSVYSSYNSASGNLINLIQNSSTQGRIEYTKLGTVGIQNLDLPQFLTTGSPTFQNLTLNGNLSVLGDLSYLNTVVSVTSALSVVNAGTGPALYIKQSGTQPIAYFDGVEVVGGVSSTILFADNGFVGLGIATPQERLVVAGSISASGGATLSGARLTNLAQTGVTTGNRLVTVETDGTLTFDALPAGTALIDGSNLVLNRLTKSTSTVTTLTASSIVDTGSAVQLDRNVSFIQQQADAAGGSNDVQVVRRVHTSNIIAGAAGTLVPTLSTGNGTINLIYSRHNVLLYTANTNRTAFEVVASNLTTAGSVSGTIFGIIDVGSTLLTDADIINNGTGTTLLLAITGNNCKAIIESVGYYAITT